MSVRRTSNKSLAKKSAKKTKTTIQAKTKAYTRSKKHTAGDKKAGCRPIVVKQSPPPPIMDPMLELDEDEILLGQKIEGDDTITRNDPSLDRRIIVGMLQDRKGLLMELAKEGIRPQAVLRRAADLGLSEAYIRQVQGVAADLAGDRPGAKRLPAMLGPRTCLCCDRVFLSSGPANRLCMRCRGGDAGLAQL